MPNSKREELEEGFMAEVTFTITASLHQDYSSENFLHEIFGKISVRNVDHETEEEAGEVRAHLIQFSEAQAHGFNPRVLGDGYSLEISRYWQELFDMDEFKTEIQTGWRTEGCDLLIVSAVQVQPKFDKNWISLAALGRTIDLFSRSCDLVACCPEWIRDHSDSTIDFSPKNTPQTGKELLRAVAMMKDDCKKVGFRQWDETGVYLLNPTRERPNVLLE